MKKRAYLWALALLGAFVLWTAAVIWVDVQAIGPQASHVGLATLNGVVHRIVGVNLWLYTVTDWLGLVPLLLAAGFGAAGLVQWVQRKSIRRVDRSLLVLGVFYVAVLAVYALFEVVVVNCRPVLIEGILESSYPSSTTVLTLCVVPTAILQLRARVKNKWVKGCATLALSAFAGFMVVGRLVSGVHWLTDILGGVLLSAGLVLLYCAAEGA